MLKFKADPNIKSIRSCQTPLHISFKFGFYDICNLLISNGAILSMQDSEGDTPIHIAYQYRKQFDTKDIKNTFPNFFNIPKYKNFLQIKNKKGITPMQLLNNDLNELIKNCVFEYNLSEAYNKVVKLNDKQILKNNEINKDNNECTSIIKKQGLDSYTALRLLGKGSFGEVYLVIEKNTKKLYAMKLFQKEKYLSQNLVKYALAEKNIMAHMKHPFIVGLHEAFQMKHKLYLIMEYCPGGDLAHILRKEGKFSEHKAKLYLAEIILAIEYLHSQNVIFRDLKPENVVIDEDGYAKLTDFGLSKEGIEDNTVTKSFCGSLAYMAPEVLQKTGHGKSIDWYLIGTLLYEMLVGQPPYYNRNKEQLFFNIKRGILRFPKYVSDNAKSLISLVLPFYLIVIK